MAAESSQYQHYVPRFILRYFATDVSYHRVFVAQPNGYLSVQAPSSAMKKRSVKKPEFINIYHVEQVKLVMASEFAKTDNSISRNFGMPDMYVDRHHVDPNHIEKMLSGLEAAAAVVIRAVIAASLGNVRAQPPVLQLVRRDFNTLLKFLFIMSYRSSGRAEQFFQDKFDPPTQRDVDLHVTRNIANKQAKGREVWLQNIREMLTSNVWDIPGNTRILIHDRMEYASDMRQRRLFLWTCSANAEFILCDTGFGFHEGMSLRVPPSMMKVGSFLAPHVAPLDPLESITGVHMCLRIFPIHPHLVLVLVHNSLANAKIDPEPLKIIKAMGPPSLFRDFPFPPGLPTEYKNLSPEGRAAYRRGDRVALMIGPEATSRQYQAMMNGDTSPATYIDGRIMESREEDILLFCITELTDQQVDLVNGLCLENARNALTFQSPEKLYRYICAYEKSPAWDNGRDYKALKGALKRIMMEKRGFASKTK